MVGLRDWVLQRLSALAIGIYTIVLFTYVMLHPALDFTAWQGLFSCIWVQVASTLVLLSLVIHTWIGVWTVCTDYIKCSYRRGGILSLVLVIVLGLLVWGLQILWGII